MLKNEAIGDALLITAKKKSYFWFVVFFPSQFLSTPYIFRVGPV